MFVQKPTFTAEDREVLNALVESLIALGSDKDSHSIEGIIQAV